MGISKLQSGIDRRSNEISVYEEYLQGLIKASRKCVSIDNPAHWEWCNHYAQMTITVLQRLREEQTKDKRLMGSVLDKEWCVRNKKLYDPSKKYRKNVTKVSNKSYKIVWQGL